MLLFCLVDAYQCFSCCFFHLWTTSLQSIWLRHGAVSRQSGGNGILLKGATIYTSKLTPETGTRVLATLFTWTGEGFSHPISKIPISSSRFKQQSSNSFPLVDVTSWRTQLNHFSLLFKTIQRLRITALDGSMD